MSSLKILICFLAIFVLHSSNGQKKYLANWESLDSRPLPQWFDDSKFGIFVHWGVFSVPSFGSEWFWYRWKTDRKSNFLEFMNKNYRPNFTYADFAKDFTAEFFNPNQWANIFKTSGAKYVVLTTKHCEGFTLWPSKYSWNWNAMDVGPNRDLVGDLGKAVREVGLRFGTYHAFIEWFNPLYLNDKTNNWKTNTFVTNKVLRELEELVHNYKPDLIWSDAEWAPSEYWKSQEFLAWLYNDSPIKDNVVVNDRWGSGTSCKHGGYWNCEDGHNPGKLINHKWENAMSIDRHSWGYRRDAKLEDYLTTHELLTTLVETVSCGGNLLMNVGPRHDGTIDPIFEQRLKDIGNWLKINGEAIYGSKPWIHQNDTIAKNVWYTKNDKTVYSIVLFWPNNNELELGSVQFNTISSIELLGSTGKAEFSSHTGGHTLVKFPNIPPESLRWAYVLKIKTK